MSLEATGFTRLYLGVQHQGCSREKVLQEKILLQQLEITFLRWQVERLFPEEEVYKEIWKEYC